MATVDPNDDKVKRYIVRRYAYDHEHHERRHQVVAAFDNDREFMTLIRAASEELDGRRAAGEEVDALEHYSGVVLEPGYRRRAAIRRLAWDATGRGVLLTESTLGRVDWDPEVGFFWSSAQAGAEPGRGP